MDMQPISPNQPLSVTLSAQEWNLVMSALNELPHRIARPIWDKLGQQLQQQSQAQLGQQLQQQSQVQQRFSTEDADNA